MNDLTNRFNLGEVNFDDDVATTLYHTGSDGGKFDYVQIVTLAGKVYECPFGIFLDGQSYQSSATCYKTVG